MKWCICCFLTFLAAAQQPASERTGLVVLEGHVVHGVSQEPIPKAHVTLELSDGAYDPALIATTDQTGRFRFAGIKPGRYTLTAEKAGFLVGEYRKEKPEGEGSLLTVNSSDPATNLTLRLFPGGVINGRILDADGDPVPNYPVILWRQGRSQDKAYRANDTTTNPAGEYRFDSISPGNYYVSAEVDTPSDHASGQIIVDSEGKPTRLRDQSTFYPAALSRAEAQVIRLESGQEQAGIDIRIQRGTVLNVKGKIAGLSGSPSGYSLSASVNAGIGWTGVIGKLLPNGEFIFEGLPPGKHRLQLLKQGGNGYEIVGRTEIDLADQDMTGVVITPFKTSQVRVRVVREDDNQLLTVGSVFFSPLDKNEPPIGNPSQFEPQNGIYFFPNIQPGQYRAWFNNASDCYLKSIQVGGRKLDTNSIEVPEASNLDLLMVFSKKVATVKGEVEMPQDQATHSVHVVLLADDPFLHLSKVFSALSDQLFHFARETMPPGSYTAFATEDSLDLWGNAEFVKLLQPKGTHVELQESKQADLHLKLISKEETDRIKQQLGL